MHRQVVRRRHIPGKLLLTEVQKPTAALEPASLNVEAGKKQQHKVKVTNFTGATYKITANSNDKAATAAVDANGKITVKGVAAGDAKITVTVTMGTEIKTLDLAVKVTVESRSLWIRQL